MKNNPAYPACPVKCTCFYFAGVHPVKRKGNSDTVSYIFLADIILIIHFLYVLFVVVGLLLIWTGGFLKWHWAKNFWFRIVHLASIAFVAIISLFGILCPLTTLESNLRLTGGENSYNQGFIQYWLHKILFYEAPEEIFTLIYVAFAIAVAGSFYFVPIQKALSPRKK